jgi:hypothetical protein
MGGVLALAGAALSVAFAPPASAHSCAQPVHVVHDRDTQVNVGVTVGDVAVNDVRIEFSNSVLVKQLVEQRGWTAQQLDDHTVRFSGGSLDPNVCATFPVVIRGTATGSFGVRAFETQTDGAVTEHPADGDVFVSADGSSITVDHAGPPNPAFEQVVYVDASDSGASTRVIVLAAAGLPLLAAAGYFVFVRRTAPSPVKTKRPRSGRKRSRR